MDADDSWLAWAMDAVAASLFAAAAGWSAALLAGTSAALAAGGLALVVALAGLRLLPAGALRFAVPDFAAPGWSEIEAQLIREQSPEPLLLDTPAVAPEAVPSSVVRLFPLKPPMPTAGDLQQRIEQHLGRKRPDAGPSAEVVPLQADASAALRQALHELRRSLP